MWDISKYHTQLSKTNKYELRRNLRSHSCCFLFNFYKYITGVDGIRVPGGPPAAPAQAGLIFSVHLSDGSQGAK